MSGLRAGRDRLLERETGVEGNPGVGSRADLRGALPGLEDDGIGIRGSAGREAGVAVGDDDRRGSGGGDVGDLLDEGTGTPADEHDVARDLVGVLERAGIVAGVERVGHHERERPDILPLDERGAEGGPACVVRHAGDLDLYDVIRRLCNGERRGEREEGEQERSERLSWRGPVE